MFNYIKCKLFNNKNTFVIFKKCFIFLFFFFCDVFCFFPQYFLILFKAILQIFQCFICVSRSLTFCHNYIFFFIAMLHCFNTTLFPCFFCNFYNHFIYIHTHKIKFFDDDFLFFIYFYFYFLSL